MRKSKDTTTAAEAKPKRGYKTKPKDKQPSQAGRYVIVGTKILPKDYFLLKRVATHKGQTIYRFMNRLILDAIAEERKFCEENGIRPGLRGRRPKGFKFQHEPQQLEFSFDT